MMVSSSSKSIVPKISWLFIIGSWWIARHPAQLVFVNAGACGRSVDDGWISDGCWFLLFGLVGNSIQFAHYSHGPASIEPFCIQERNLPVDLTLTSVYCDPPGANSHKATLLGPQGMRMTDVGNGLSLNNLQPKIYNWIPGDYLFQYALFCGQDQSGQVESFYTDTFTITGYCDEEVPPASNDIILYQQERPKLGKNDTKPSYEVLKKLSADNMTICIHANRKVTVQYFYDNPSSVTFTIVGPKHMRYTHTEYHAPYLLYGNPSYTGLPIADVKAKSWFGRYWSLGNYSLTVVVSTESQGTMQNKTTTRSFTVSQYCSS